MLAHVVPHKGSQYEWVAERLQQDVRRFGYNGRLVLRSDGEPSIKDLLSNLAKKRGDAPTVLENSKPYDSKSNGRAENAVKRVECMVRTFKLAVEEATGKEVEVSHPVFEWLVEHCADVLTKVTVGEDGKTPYEWIKQKAYSGTFFEFGSMVWAKLPGKVQGGLMRERWVLSVWLGKKWSSDEHIVALQDGRVVRVRDVAPEPDERAYDKERLWSVKGTPSNPSAGIPESDFRRDIPRAPAPRPESPAEPPVVRRATLKHSYFRDRYGYTSGCAKCNSLKRGDDARDAHSYTKGHSEECRKRIEELMKSDPTLNEHLDAAKIRQDEYLARMMERNLGERPATQATPPATLPPPPADSSVPVVEAEEDGIPELGADVDDETNAGPIPKRARLSTDQEEIDTSGDRAEAGGSHGHPARPADDRPVSSGAPPEADNEEEEDPDGEDGPSPKRARVGSVGAVFTQKVCWADLAEEEEDERRRARRQDAGLVLHVENRFNGSGTIGHVSTDDDSPTRQRKSEEQSKEAAGHVETRGGSRSTHVYDICEVFSPTRISRAAERQGLKGGWSLDLSSVCPVIGRKWDCRKLEDRKWALKMIWRHKPWMVVVSPPCTLFSQLQNLSPNVLPKDRCPELWARAL